MGLAETKMIRNKEDKFKHKFLNTWKYALAYNENGKCRIQVGWNTNQWEADVVHSNSMYLTLKNVGGVQLAISVVNGSNLHSTRKKLWAELETLASGIHILWLVLGDLNCVKYTENLGQVYSRLDLGRF